MRRGRRCRRLSLRPRVSPTQSVETRQDGDRSFRGRSASLHAWAIVLLAGVALLTVVAASKSSVMSGPVVVAAPQLHLRSCAAANLQHRHHAQQGRSGHRDAIPRQWLEGCHRPLQQRLGRQGLRQWGVSQPRVRRSRHHSCYAARWTGICAADRPKEGERYVR